MDSNIWRWTWKRILMLLSPWENLSILWLVMLTKGLLLHSPWKTQKGERWAYDHDIKSIQLNRPDRTKQNQSNVEKEGVHQSCSPPASKCLRVSKWHSQWKGHSQNDYVASKLLHRMNCYKDQFQTKHHSPCNNCKEKVEAEKCECRGPQQA